MHKPHAAGATSKTIDKATDKTVDKTVEKKPAAAADTLRVRHLGQVAYRQTWEAMRDFTVQRTAQTVDELWVLEHPPVYTLGQASRPEHLLNTGSIEVVQVDRGGQVTYHGPGQLVIYLLIDIGRRHLNVRPFVSRIEAALLKTLEDFAISAYAKADAPGVYVQAPQGEAKIASLGLRIKNGRSYHGLSLNIDMDMQPFLYINPCGFAGMQMTQLSSLVKAEQREDLLPKAAQVLVAKLQQLLGYENCEHLHAASLNL